MPSCRRSRAAAGRRGAPGGSDILANCSYSRPSERPDSCTSSQVGTSCTAAIPAPRANAPATAAVQTAGGEVRRRPDPGPDRRHPEASIQGVEESGRGAVQGCLWVAGKQLQGEDRGGETETANAAAARRQLQGREQERHPGRDVDEVLRHGAHYRVAAQREGQSAGQRPRTAGADQAQVGEGSHPPEPEVKGDVVIDRHPGRQQQRRQQVEGIQDPGLALGEQRKAAVDPRVPERKLELPEHLGTEVPEGVVLDHYVLDEERPLEGHRLPEIHGNREGRAAESRTGGLRHRGLSGWRGGGGPGSRDFSAARTARAGTRRWYPRPGRALRRSSGCPCGRGSP